jgi:hypothetical protein
VQAEDLLHEEVQQNGKEKRKNRLYILGSHRKIDDDTLIIISPGKPGDFFSLHL